MPSKEETIKELQELVNKKESEVAEIGRRMYEEQDALKSLRCELDLVQNDLKSGDFIEFPDGRKAKLIVIDNSIKCALVSTKGFVTSRIVSVKDIASVKKIIYTPPMKW